MTATADQGRAAQRFPLLERDREIRRILAAIRHPGNGRGRLFVVEGPAGIGRSRLLLEVASRARRHGAGVLQLRLANPQDTSLPVPADPDRTLVIVDDVQSCDRAGAQRLGRCLADARKGGAVVLLALRSSEGRSTDPWATGRLRRDRSAALLRLAPLSHRPVRRVLERLCGIEPDTGFVTVCHRATGGNPALVHELALALVELAIAPVESSAEIVERLALPPVGRRVLARLSPLHPSAIPLAVASAVLGDGTPIARAATLAGLIEQPVGDAHEALCGDGVLAPGDRVRFAQPIVARSILAAMRPSELCRWRRHAADVLDTDDAPLEEITAQLLGAAPAGERALVGRCRLGAHRARQVGDCGAAVAHLRRALEEGVPEFERDLTVELAQVHAGRSPADAILLLARAHQLSGPPTGRAVIGAELRRLERELAAAAGD